MGQSDKRSERDLHLERLRRAQKPQRRKEPYRIIITSDADRPARTWVIPRRAPLIAASVTTVLVAAALGFGFVSFQLNTGLARVQTRLASMMRVADELARSPNPGPPVMAATESAPSLHLPMGGVARLELELVNTGERLTVEVNPSTGEVLPESYRRLRRFMRCQRTGAETPLDPRLIEALYQLATRTRQRIQIVSGFRAPMFSTADLSYHTRGMAADIRIPGMTPLMVRDLALGLGLKGVGYYPVSRFVHIDVREDRFTWTDYGKDRDDGEGREHGPMPLAAEDPSATP